MTSSTLVGLPLLLASLISTQVAQPPPPPKPYEPTVGMAGRDAVWVPTSAGMVAKMLDMAKVTKADVVIDLGSGDGRMIIAAAKRGARARGVEFTPELVEHSRKLARDAGVADRATFVQGDMYVADISDATVVALFLLPENLDKLKDKFLALKPGSRIVLNTYKIPGWEPDVTEVITGDCTSWCTSMLHFVPAKVAGVWKLPAGQLTLSQSFQMLSGELVSGASKTPIADARMRGDEITFNAGGVTYTGRVSGKNMSGKRSDGQTWTATRSS
jgi:SAM-dependent methyltransferase